MTSHQQQPNHAGHLQGALPQQTNERLCQDSNVPDTDVHHQLLTQVQAVSDRRAIASRQQRSRLECLVPVATSCADFVH